LPKNADSAAILRAYRNKLREAKGNDAATERIEAAHTSLLMRGLNSRLTVCLAADALPSIVWRMARFADGVQKAVLSLHLRQLSHQRLLPFVAQGGATVAADVKYADRAVYFPWRPRCSARCSHRALGVSAWRPGGFTDTVTACDSSTGLLGLAGRPKWLPGQALRQRAAASYRMAAAERQRAPRVRAAQAVQGRPRHHALGRRGAGAALRVGGAAERHRRLAADHHVRLRRRGRQHPEAVQDFPARRRRPGRPWGREAAGCAAHTQPVRPRQGQQAGMPSRPCWQWRKTGCAAAK